MRNGAASVLTVILLAACGSAPEKPAAPAADSPAPAAKAAEGTGPLTMVLQTDKGEIRCRLFEKEAPVTVEKITGLAKKGFYDGLIFHRVIPNFMIQTGDPTGTGRGGAEGPGFPFQDEFSPRLKFDEPGRLAMANRGRNTNESQFFITEQPVPHLNGLHTIFGDCTGIAVVRQIARVPTRNEKPLTPVHVKKVFVERRPN
jgi:peptidyl-prolyl cis-trans isomerase A (cyclophilin A)